MAASSGFSIARWIRSACVVGMVLPCVLCSQEFPAPVGYVNDFAKVISSSEAAQIETICRELEEKTTAELAVVTVQSVGDIDYAEYANRLFEKWGIGKKGQDNGVLLFLTVRERRIRIETGYGLEGTIPDITAGRILDDYVIEELRRGNYGTGMLAGAKAIAGVIAVEKGVQIGGAIQPRLRQIPSSRRNPSTSSPQTGDRDLSVPFGMLFILVIIAIMFIFAAKGGGSGDYHNRDDSFHGGFGGGFGGGGSSGGGGGGFGGFGGGSSGGGGAGRGF